MNYRDDYSLAASNVMVPKSTFGYPRQRTVPHMANAPQNPPNHQIVAQRDYLARSALESAQSTDETAIRNALLIQQVDNSSVNATLCFSASAWNLMFSASTCSIFHIDFWPETVIALPAF
jgi:hypothetical protein